MKANKNILLKYIFSTLFFLAGVTAAVLLVQRVKPKNEKPNPKQDTVFVKLVDQFFHPVLVRQYNSVYQKIPLNNLRKKYW